MNTVKENAYAKINLYLDVISVRDDGFHNIKTVMHSVSLFDEVTVSVVPARVTSVKLAVEKCGFLPTDSKNLAYQAAVLFLESCGKNAEVTVNLTKNIPIAAGLAGGSSDAAAVLRALNKIYKKPFTAAALAKMSAALGSDVPYCVIGKTALCEGRGEIMTPIATDRILNVVIATAGERTSTPEAYRILDEKYSSFDGSVKGEGENYFVKIMSELASSSIPTVGLFNIFESAVLDSCPGALKIKEMLIELGATGAIMSGSGPAVFGIFESEESARKAEASLRNDGYNAWYAKSV